MFFNRRKTLGNPAARFRQYALVGCLLGCAANPPAKPPRPAAQRAADLPGDANMPSKTEAAPQLVSSASQRAPATPMQGEGTSSAAELQLPSSLSIDHFEPAVLRWAAAQVRAPLFVITHGAGGFAEWHCQHYAALLGSGGTLLCPSGRRMFASDPSRGYYYPNHVVLAEELQGARDAMLQHYAMRIREEAIVYVGYSQGASMGVLAVHKHGDWWPRLLLVEGGYDGWTASLSKRYAASGGRRVLFVCGTAHCREHARASVGLLERAGVAAQLRVANGAGHRPDGPVAAAVRDGLGWLLDDGSAFSQIRDALSAPAATQVTDENAAHGADAITPR
jgi:predicted esterase